MNTNNDEQSVIKDIVATVRIRTPEEIKARGPSESRLYLPTSFIPVFMRFKEDAPPNIFFAVYTTLLGLQRMYPTWELPPGKPNVIHLTGFNHSSTFLYVKLENGALEFGTMHRKSEVFKGCAEYIKRQGKKQPYDLWPYSIPQSELTWLETFEFEAASREAGTKQGSA